MWSTKFIYFAHIMGALITFSMGLMSYPSIGGLSKYNATVIAHVNEISNNLITLELEVVKTNGDKIVALQDGASLPAAAQIGETVEVFLDEETIPPRAIINKFEQMWLHTMIFWIMTICCLFSIPVSIMWNNKMKDKMDD